MRFGARVFRQHLFHDVMDPKHMSSDQVSSIISFSHYIARFFRDLFESLVACAN